MPDRADRLVDAALSTYGDAEPGLERRVLARIASEPRRAPRPGRMVWATLSMAAALLLLIVFVSVRLPRSTGTHAFNPHLAQQAPKSEARAEPRATQSGNKSSGPQRREHASDRSAIVTLPKEEMFPMPQPLSPEEQTLAKFAAQSPKAERTSFIWAQEHLAEPIRISAIHIDAIRIPPIESPQSGSN
jgi:hypothetical protein